MQQPKDMKQVQEVFGYIAALRTMLDNYPDFTLDKRIVKLLESTSPLDFIINLMEICGLSKKDLLNWVSKILCGAEALVYEKKENTYHFLQQNFPHILSLSFHHAKSYML